MTRTRPGDGRLMSVALTTDAVRARQKTVTRRNGWHHLKPGDHLQLVVKAMGLRKGEHPELVERVRVVSVRREPLALVDFEEVQREGLEAEGREEVYAGRFDTAASWFIDFWLRSHGYPADADPAAVEVTRIEWEYLSP